MCFCIRKWERYGDVWLRKKGDFVLKLIISKWEGKQGQTKIKFLKFVRICILREECYVWSRLDKIQMN